MLVLNISDLPYHLSLNHYSSPSRTFFCPFSSSSLTYTHSQSPSSLLPFSSTETVPASAGARAIGRKHCSPHCYSETERKQTKNETKRRKNHENYDWRYWKSEMPLDDAEHHGEGSANEGNESGSEKKDGHGSHHHLGHHRDHHEEVGFSHDP